MRGRQALLALATLAISVAISVAMVEGAVRLLESAGFFPSAVFPDDPYVPRSRLSEYPILGWELDPSADDVSSAGFRDVEIPLRKRPGRTRIALLGDSVAYGHGLPREQAVADQLEVALGDGYEVLNAGVGGYNTEQEAEFYARRVRPFEPDVVVVLYVLNDAIPAERLLRIVALVATMREAPEPPAPLGLRALRRFGEAVERLRRRDPDQIAPYVHETHRDEQTWRTVEEGLARIGSIAREDGARLLLAITPFFFDLDDYAFADVHEQVAAAARREGFSVLDLREALRGHDPVSLRLDGRDVIHPNALGHRLMAQAIARELRRIAPPRVGRSSGALGVR
jgi:lysophospholipase L1-like esterase